MSVTPSRFIRHDLMCTDVAAGTIFYRELFGWTTTEVKVMAFNVVRLAVGDQVLGAIIPFDAQMGFPSHWVPYVYVDSVERCCEQVPTLGGTVCMGATQFPPGRFALVTDPQQAIFSPFTPSGGNPADPAKRSLTGSFCWDELLTNDIDGARKFYTGLFGWGTTDKDMGPTDPYTLFTRGSVPIAGMMRMPPDAGRRPAWLAYIAVEDVDATAKRAQQLGGKIVFPPTDIPDVGRFAVLIDSTKAAFAILNAQR